MNGKIEGVNSKIEGVNSKIEGVKFTINAVLVGVTIIIAFFGLPHVARILGKREREYASQDRAQPPIREIIRVENGYRDEAKMQANAIDRAEIQGYDRESPQRKRRKPQSQLTL